MKESIGETTSGDHSAFFSGRLKMSVCSRTFFYSWPVHPTDISDFPFLHPPTYVVIFSYDPILKEVLIF